MTPSSHTRTFHICTTPCSVDIKELRMRPVTEQHDYDVKLKQARGFLQKVRLGCM